MADEVTTTTENTSTEGSAAQTPNPSEVPNTSTADNTAPESAQTKTDDDGTDWKSQARKWEQRAKENSKAAQELEKIRRDQMTEQQKLEADAKAALERAEQAERRAALAEAAITHGLTKDDLELLDGVPADQIEDRAKKLAARIKKAAPAASSGSEVGGGRGRPKPTTLEGAISRAFGG